MICCGKIICCGCIHAFQSRAAKKEDHKCPFCRTLAPTPDEGLNKIYEKRVELNDAQAIYSIGCHYAQGQFGFPQNRAKALELWHRSAELGYAEAYASIGYFYKNGTRVEIDETMAQHYFELAAMRGHVISS